MLRLIILGAAITLLAGCANYHQLLISNSGAIKQCAASGVGLIPMYQAEQAFNSCVSGLKSVGFVEIEKAGVLGITLVQDKEDIRVVQVITNSPAEASGIKVSDCLVSIGDTEIKNIQEVYALMFGGAHTTIKLAMRRGPIVTKYTLTRAAYPDVFGSK